MSETDMLTCRRRSASTTHALHLYSGSGGLLSTHVVSVAAANCHHDGLREPVNAVTFKWAHLPLEQIPVIITSAEMRAIDEFFALCEGCTHTVYCMLRDYDYCATRDQVPAATGEIGASHEAD